MFFQYHSRLNTLLTVLALLGVRSRQPPPPRATRNLPPPPQKKITKKKNKKKQSQTKTATETSKVPGSSHTAPPPPPGSIFGSRRAWHLLLLGLGPWSQLHGAPRIAWPSGPTPFLGEDGTAKSPAFLFSAKSQSCFGSLIWVVQNQCFPLVSS